MTSNTKVSINYATPERTPEIHQLVENCIRLSYADHYPPRIVDWFCSLHSPENIQEDVTAERTIIAVVDGKTVATGTLKQNHIVRVFVDPSLQMQGLGSLIMDYLEEKTKVNGFSTAVLDTSLPAKSFYLHRGYKVVSLEHYPIENELILDYEVMQKIL